MAGEGLTFLNARLASTESSILGKALASPKQTDGSDEAPLSAFSPSWGSKLTPAKRVD